MKITQTLNLFTPEECLNLIIAGQKLPQVDWEYERGAHRGTVNLKKTGAAIPIDSGVSWIFDRITPLMGEFKINRWEPLQYGVYKPGCFMDWHLDRGTSEGDYPDGAENNYMVDRVVAGIIQLSHPDDYQGGDLQIQGLDQIHPTRKARGSLVVLSSDVSHRVTEVTRGIRRTLVIWGLK